MKANFSNNVILLKGNHEDMAYKYARNLDNSVYSRGIDDTKKIYFYNGGIQTLKSYTNTEYIVSDKEILEDFIMDMYWLNELPMVHVTERYVFVHAGLKPNIALYQQKKERRVMD